MSSRAPETSGGRTVVFGGGGFVGLNIVETLLGSGRAVELVDPAPPPQAALEALRRLPGELRVTSADVRDADQITRLLATDVDAVVYGAAITAGAERDAREPERILEVNLLGLVHVLRAARDGGVRRVVNLSSSAAYGEAAWGDTESLEETIAPDPTTLYALTKFATERAARRLGGLWDLDVRSVRLSAVFGRWERQTGDRDTPSALYQIMRAAQLGKPAILARDAMRDWIYAPDVARAVIALIDAAEPGFDLYNVSTGQPFSTLAWGGMLAQRRPGFVCRIAEPGEPATIDLFADRDRAPLSILRLSGDLGFRPQFDLEGSVDDYHRWSDGHPLYDPADREPSRG